MSDQLKIFSGSNITDLDATEILAKVSNYISSNNDRYKWATFYEGLAGTMLMETMAGVAEYLLYIIERKSQELNIDTARLKSSLYMLAATRGIMPNRKKSARGMVTYVLSRPAQGPVELNVFDGAGAITYQGNQYVPRSTVTIPNNAVTFSTWYVQGEWVATDFTSTGQVNETFLIQEEDWKIDQDEFYLYYEGAYREFAPWPNPPTNSQVSIKTHYSGGVLAVTGDNNIGRKFNQGDVLKFVYLRTDGAQGNIPIGATDCSFELGTFTAQDGAGDLTVTAYLESSFIGGKNETSAETIKAAYYASVGSSESVVSSEDLLKVIQAIEGIDDARMCSVGACCSMGVCLIKSDESELTEADLTRFASELSPKMTPTALPTYSAATKVPVRYTLNVKVAPGYDMANIFNAVTNYLSSQIYHKLGATFDVSTYTVEIAKLEGVTGIEFSPCNSLTVECCQYISTEDLTINVVY